VERECNAKASTDPFTRAIHGMQEPSGMKSELDCVPCFVRQVLQAVRMVSGDPAAHEEMVREMLLWIAELDFSEPPPLFARHVYRRLRDISGIDDPYEAVKIQLNRMATRVVSRLKTNLDNADDPLLTAVKLSIAGNVIDLGANDNVSEVDVLRSVDQVLSKPLDGDYEGFREAASRARQILYLADNAGEIVFDRLLIETLSPGRVTVAVRGAAVINDATIADARTAGLQEICTVIDNGSDAPGTLLDDCSASFRRRFAEADLIIAKGQGNFESLSQYPGNLFFLLKVKCPVVAAHAKLPVGSHAILTVP
jgi:uncharacterized protein with ATP-grasp and redox domains